MLSVFFFNDTATTEIYTLSLHDALPIYQLLASLLQDLHAHHPVHLRSFLALVYREPPRSALTFVQGKWVETDRPKGRSGGRDSRARASVFCAATPGSRRSEERRVGKECRSRWSP